MAALSMKMMTVEVMSMASLLFAAVQNTVSAQAVCGLDGCQAWALFVFPLNDTLFVVANRFSLANFTVLQNLNNISDPDNIEPGQLLRIPFTCDCRGNDTIRYHSFSYSVRAGDLGETIATMKFSNLTTVDAIDKANVNADGMLAGTVLQVPINCSCGDPAVSKDYGMFGTYAAQPNDTLSSLSHKFGISQELLRNYNPAVSFDPLQPFTSILFIPTTKNVQTGGGGPRKGVIIGSAVGSVLFFVMLALVLWLLLPKCRRKSRRFYNKDEMSCQPKVAVDS
ncbi:hypothetical protein L7F22_021867, partial [Adiantum nelumboides]|nr:hypothetical protein [Adiantum nelumboides]